MKYLRVIFLLKQAKSKFFLTDAEILLNLKCVASTKKLENTA